MTETRSAVSARYTVYADALVQLDAAANPGLAQRFGVRSVPTLVFLKDGGVVDTRTGVDRKQVLKKIVETHA